MASVADIKKRIQADGFGSESSQRIKNIKDRMKDEGFSWDVDENYINTFITDANNFIESAQTDYKGIEWGNASSTYDSKRETYSDLNKRTDYLNAWLKSNKDRLDAETYKSLSESLKTISSSTSSIMSGFEEYKNYYSQWETEEDYNKAVEESKKYEEMMSYNLEAGKSDVEWLTNKYNTEWSNYELTIQNTTERINKLRSENQTLGVSAAKGDNEAYEKKKENEKKIAEYTESLNKLKAEYAPYFREFMAHISEKEQYNILAERVQSAEKIKTDAINDPNFDKYVKAMPITQEEWLSNWDKNIEDAAVGEYEDGVKKYLTESDLQYRALKYMKPDEYKIYSYYFMMDAKNARDNGTENTQELSTKYLESIEETLNARLGEYMYSRVEDNWFLEYCFAAKAGVEQYGSGIRNLFSGEDYIPVTATEYASGMIREDLADSGFKLPDWLGGASIGQVGYDLVNTSANMLPSMIVSAVPGVGQALGAVSIGMSSAGNTKTEMLREGYSLADSTQAGLLTGIAEACLQYLLGGITKLGGKVSGKAISTISSKINNGVARAAIKIGGNMASEGLEEALQSILEPYIKSIATGQDVEDIDWEEVAYSGLLGMATAGAFEGVGSAGNVVGNKVAYNQQLKQHGQSIIDNGGVDSLHTLALDTAGANQNKQGQKIANLAGKVAGKASAKNVGKLSAYLQETLSTQNKADIKNALINKGLSEKDATRVAEYLAGTNELTEKQKAEIESNENIKAVISELLDNPNSTISERARSLIYARLGASSKASNMTSKATNSGNMAVKVEVDVEDKVSESGKTTRISTGEEITINKNNAIAKVKMVDGKRVVYINTNQGIVEESDVEYSSEDEALIYESFVDMNPAFANAVIKNYDGSVPVQTYINGMREGIIIYGMHNFQAVGKDIHTASHLAELSKVDQDFALKLGRAYAQAEAKKASAPLRKAMQNAERRAASNESAPKNVKGGKVSFENGVKATTKNEKRAVRLAKFLSAAIGIDIVFYDARTTTDKRGEGANGFFDEETNAIHLDLQKAHDDTKTIAFTLSHELVHFIKKWSPDKFNTFAKFLMEQYAKHGVDTSTMLSNKMVELKTKDADLAYEEMICDACETMLLDSNAMVKLMKLRQTDLDLFEKLKLHIMELLNNLRDAYRKLGFEATTDEAKALLKMTDVLEKLHSMFEDAAVDATQSFQTAQTLNTEAVSVTEDGTVRLQMKQYQQTGRATLLNYLREQYGNEDANDLISTIDNIYDAMAEIKNNEALSVFSNWQDTDVELDENGHPIFTTSIKNGDDELNQDFSRVCKKRRQLDFVLNMLAEDPAFEASHLTKQDFVKINKAIKEHGFEIACALCFVDSKRFRQAEWADSFANTWNDILNAVVKDGSKLTPFNFATKNPNVADEGIEIDTSKAVTYRKWSDGKEDVKNRRTYESFEQMLSKAEDGKWLEGNTNVRTIATLIRDNPELRHTFRGADIIASQGFDTIQRLAPGIRSILDGWGGSSVPKPSSNDASYDSSIINMSGYNKTTAYAMGGVRMNSFSDFMAHMFFDYCQAFADLSAKELPSQAYTKELIYVRLFGRSGQKINMSGIAAIRDNSLPTTAGKGVTKAEAEANEKIEKMVAGLDVTRLLEHLNKDIHQLTEADVEQFLDMCDYVWADESINMKHATLLQTGILYDKLSESKVEECYELLKAGEIEQALKVAGKDNVDTEYAKNCGTIVVGVSDAHIRKLLRDPNVRMVIPYHKSGLNPIIARELRISAYNDYTLAQSTGVKRKGSKATDKIGSTAIKDAYGLKDFEFYDWFGKTIDGKLYDGKATADKYLEWCEKGYYDEKVGDYVYYTNKGDGYILAKDFHKKASIVPKFDTFVGEENYYKVLEDFDCYDTITGEHSAQGAVDFLRNGLPSDYKDVLVGALKEEQKVHDDFKDHLDNKGLKEEVMDIVKARGYEPSIKKQAKKNAEKATIDLTDDTALSKLVEGVHGALRYKTIANYILDALGKDPITLSDGTVAIVDNSDALHVANKAGNKKTAHISKIKEIIEKAQLYAYDDNADHNKFSKFLYYDVVVRYQNEQYPLYLNVGLTINDKTYHIYDITEKIRDTANRINGLERPKPNEGYALKNDISDKSISYPNDSVKRQLKKDSQGNTLSEEQAEFFKDSKVRDNKGNLLVVYHGTTANFNVFKKGDIGFHFGTKGAARGRVGFGKNVTIKEVYLNLTNPIEFDEDLGSWDADYRLTRELYDKGILTKEEAESVLFSDDKTYRRSTEAANKKLSSVLMAKGYDGISYQNTFETKKATTSYIVFNSNQAKEITNKAPTSNPDIRYQKKKLSNRTILSNALESSIDTSTQEGQNELRWLKEYQDKITLIEKEEAHLAEVNAEIKEISFTKGSDRSKLSELNAEKTRTANRITTFDKQLMRLETMKPIKDVLAREKEMVRKRTEQKGKETMAKLREREAEKTRILLNRASESRKKGIEGRKKTEMRHKVKDIVSDLNKLLLNPTKDQHVPIGLQLPVAQALAIVNMDTIGAEERIKALQDELMKAKTPEKAQEIAKKIEYYQNIGGRIDARLSALKTAYDNIVNSEDPLVANAHDEVISQMIAKVQEDVGSTPIRDMSLSQLEEVYDLFKAVLTTIRNANKSFKGAQKERYDTLASRVMEEIDTLGIKRKPLPRNENGKEKGGLRKGKESFAWNNQKPIYAFEQIGSNTLTGLYENVRAGEDTWAQDIQEAREFFISARNKYGYNSWDLSETFTFKSTTGKGFEISLDMIMSLYAYSKRGKQAIDHITHGGIVLDDGTGNATSYKISEETLSEIISKVTSNTELKAFVDEMQEYLSSVMGEKGNEVALELYGIKLFKEKFYFPLKSSPIYMAKSREQDQTKGEVKIKNYGITKETKEGAKNPIILSSFVDVWANHVNEMSMYHSFVLPMEDFYRVFNYHTPYSQETEAVRAYIQNAYGDSAVSYVDQLLKDLNGGAVSDPREGFAKGLMTKFKKAKTMLSLSVIVQQPTSVVRAMALVDAKYFLGKPSMRKHGETWAEVKKYAPVAIIKEMGYFDTNMGRSATDYITGQEYHGIKEKAKALVKDGNYRDEAFSKLPALADELAWCSIWNAIKREVVHTHPNLTPNSEAFLKVVGERFTEVITRTQVYDSTLSRSGWMRSKSGLVNMWTAFLGEPTTSINMLGNAILNIRRGNKKMGAKAIGGLIGAVVFNAALVSLVYAMRDDDEDETFLEKYTSRFSTELLEGFNPLTYIPFIKDVWSITQGYDVERTDMSLISDLWSSFEKVITVLAKDTEDMDEKELEEYQKEIGGSLWDIVGSICSLTGLPVENVSRDIKGIINSIGTINKDATERDTTWSSLGDEVWEDVKDSIPVVGKLPDESKADKLYDAIISGDNAYRERLESSYDTESKLNSAIRKALRDNDPRIKEAAEAWLEGDMSEYYRILEEIKDEGNFDIENIKAAIKSEYNDMNDDSGDDDEEGTDEVESTFETEHYYLAIINGDTFTASKIKEDLIDTAIANGDSEEEAEESVASGFRTNCKKGYINNDISRAEAMDMLVKYGGKNSDDAYWELKKWDYIAANGSDEGYSKYGNFYEAVQTGKNLKSVISEYTSHGVTNETLSKQITSYFKPLYKNMSNAERANIKGYLLNAYEQLGYNRYKKAQDINKWLEDN